MDRAKLFKNGDSQAVRLPKEYRFSGKEVYVRRQGKTVILTPINDVVDRLWESLDAFSEDAIGERDQPTHYDQRLSI